MCSCDRLPWDEVVVRRHFVWAVLLLAVCSRNAPRIIHGTRMDPAHMDPAVATAGAGNPPSESSRPSPADSHSFRRACTCASCSLRRTCSGSRRSSTLVCAARALTLHGASKRGVGAGSRGRGPTREIEKAKMLIQGMFNNRRDGRTMEDTHVLVAAAEQP